jgi:hypothetical protein
MKIFEVESADTQRLAALLDFLHGQSINSASKGDIAVDTFVQSARNLGIIVDPESLPDLLGRPPLSNMIEPFQPYTKVIRFKGSDTGSTKMSVDKAEEIVNQNAKQAMKRAMK